MNRPNSASLSSNAEWGTFVPSGAGVGRAPKNLFLDRLSSFPVRDVPMQVDDAPSKSTFAPPPPRTAIKKPTSVPSHRALSISSHRPAAAPSGVRRQVSFNAAVDVRVALNATPNPSMLWLTADEIKSMRSSAMQRNSPLRHSEQMMVSPQLQQQILASPPSASSLRRVESATAELRATSSSVNPNPRNIRYEQLMAEVDREVYITNEERRDSTRRRLHHYDAVFNDLDRQIDSGYRAINIPELSQASLKGSTDSLQRAQRRGRREATLAKAVLMDSRRRLL